MHQDDDAVALKPVSDLAGMPVEDEAGRNIGEIFGALAEAESGLLRYFDLALFGRPRHVLVPVGHARIEPHVDAPRLRLRAASLEDLEQIPTYHADPETVDDPYERALLHAYGRSFHGERYYAHPAYDHGGLYAGAHPLVRDEANAAPARLAPAADLPPLNFAAGQPDVRGWKLQTADQRDAGVIEDLIIDTAERQLRYLVIRPTGHDHSILLPVGFLRLDPDDDAVRTPGLTPADLAALPPYRGGAVDRDTENRLRSAIEQRLHDRRRRYQTPDFNLADR
jgi:hypothetical protein